MTKNGLAAIDAEISALRTTLAAAEPGEREKVALASRDLRYWLSRRENAELTIPEVGSDVVRFGMTVTLEGEDGKGAAWTIVGEDEADPSKGTISHVSPMAQALFGKAVGDVVTVNGREWEIVGLK